MTKFWSGPCVTILTKYSLHQVWADKAVPCFQPGNQPLKKKKTSTLKNLVKSCSFSYCHIYQSPALKSVYSDILNSWMSESGMFCVQTNAEDFRSCCSILCIHSVLYISTASYQTESEAMQLGLSHCSVQYSNGIPTLKICAVSYTACLLVINHYTVQYLHPRGLVRDTIFNFSSIFQNYKIHRLQLIYLKIIFIK